MGTTVSVEGTFKILNVLIAAARQGIDLEHGSELRSSQNTSREGDEMIYLYYISMRPHRALEMILGAGFHDNEISHHRIDIIIIIHTIIKYPMTRFKK